MISINHLPFIKSMKHLILFRTSYAFYCFAIYVRKQKVSVLLPRHYMTVLKPKSRNVILILKMTILTISTQAGSCGSSFYGFDSIFSTLSFFSLLLCCFLKSNPFIRFLGRTIQPILHKTNILPLLIKSPIRGISRYSIHLHCILIGIDSSQFICSGYTYGSLLLVIKLT